MRECSQRQGIDRDEEFENARLPGTFMQFLASLCIDVSASDAEIDDRMQVWHKPLTGAIDRCNHLYLCCCFSVAMTSAMELHMCDHTPLKRAPRAAASSTDPVQLDMARSTPDAAPVPSGDPAAPQSAMRATCVISETSAGTPVKEEKQLAVAGVLRVRLLNLIGQGNFGKVYRGITSQGKLVAVKQIALPSSTARQVTAAINEIQVGVCVLPWRPLKPALRLADPWSTQPPAHRQTAGRFILSVTKPSAPMLS